LDEGLLRESGDEFDADVTHFQWQGLCVLGSVHTGSGSAFSDGHQPGVSNDSVGTFFRRTRQ
jgi:hypothetical protein